MAGVEKRSFDSPDESRTPDKTQADVVHMGGTTAARLTLQPGWFEPHISRLALPLGIRSSCHNVVTPALQGALNEVAAA